MRVVFMGTPEFAVPALSEILTAGHEVAAVYTQPPRPAGRGMSERKSAVHAFADGAGIAVVAPKSLKGEAEQQVVCPASRRRRRGRGLRADPARSRCWRRRARAASTCMPRRCRAGAVPPPSSAPSWRATRETAATVMRMEAGLDTGPICLEERVPIGARHDRGRTARPARRPRRPPDGAGARQPGARHPALPAQAVDGVTYAAKIGKDEGRIDFARPAGEVHNHIRGLSPVPGAWFEVRSGDKPERIKVLRASPVRGLGTGLGAPGMVLDDRLTIACGEGAIRVLQAQRAGKRPMTADELLRGFALPAGTQL